MARGWLARAAAGALLLAGCAFDGGGSALPDGVADAGAGGADAEGDAPETAIDAMPPPACPANDDLVACYAFEAADGAQPHDGSGYGNHGQSQNVTLVAGPPGHGSAALFSEQTSMLVPDSASLDVISGITMEAFVRVDELPASGGRAGIVDNNGQYGLFVTAAGEVRCATGSVTVTGLSLTSGQWTHVRCTYDGAALQLYQNGAPGAFVMSMVPLNTGGTDGLGLGQNSPSGDHLHGALDEVRIWRVAMPPPPQ